MPSSSVLILLPLWWARPVCRDGRRARTPGGFPAIHRFGLNWARKGRPALHKKTCTRKPGASTRLTATVPQSARELRASRGIAGAGGPATAPVQTEAEKAAAEKAASGAGFGAQSSYFACAMIAQCITEWQGIASVTIDHVLDLYRADVLKLQGALAELEAADENAEASKNSRGGEA